MHHPSMTRLLNCASDATRGKRREIHDFKGLGDALGVSSAVMTNWKKRGISKEGALTAARLFGCSTTWVLDGVGSPGPTTAAQVSPVGDELLAALTFLAEAVKPLDEATRLSVAPLFSLLAQKPEQLGNIVTTLRKLIPPTAEASTSGDHVRKGARIEALLPTGNMEPRHGEGHRIQGRGGKT